jgi:hypothetical protein
MATMVEEQTMEEQRSVVRFMCAKGLNAKDIHKKIISCLIRLTTRILPLVTSICLVRYKTTFVANVSLMTKRLKRR